MAQKHNADSPKETPLHDRTKRLRQLMEQHRLKVSDVARIIGCSETTVRIWRCKSEGRVVPAITLRLLELEVNGGAAA